MSNNWGLNEPYRLLFLLVAPIYAFVYYKYFRNKQPSILVSHISDNIQPAGFCNPESIFLLTRILAFLFLLIACAQPYTNKLKKYNVSAESIDFVFAIDASGSMLIEDIKPNRLEALKEVLANFIAARSHDKFGLILYAGESVVWSPLTRDYRFLINKINTINDKEMVDGTAIGLGLASGINMMRSSNSKNKVIILLTDGENNAGFVNPLTASKLAGQYNVKVYTIGIGTTGKAPMPIINFDGEKSYQYVDVKLDEVLLNQIANLSGGKYFRATDRNVLKNIYQSIDKLETKKRTVQLRSEKHFEYRIFTCLAILFIILEISLSITLFKTVN
jgi:Ca-activated chloride channel family protein